jgi:hypothetical protein
MTHVAAVVVRLVALGLALTAYTLLVVPRMASAGDDGLGAGLVAFAALALVGLVGALIDAARVGFVVALGWWVAVAVGLAVGWWVVLAVPQDSSLTFAESLSADAGLVPFTTGLVAVPALVGAAVGGALHRSRREP